MTDRYYELVSAKVNAIQSRNRSEQLKRELNGIREKVKTDMDILEKFPGMENECAEAIRNYRTARAINILSFSYQLRNMDEEIEKLPSSLLLESKLKEKVNEKIDFWRNSMTHDIVTSELSALRSLKNEIAAEKDQIEKDREERKKKTIKNCLIAAGVIAGIILICVFWNIVLIILGIALAIYLIYVITNKNK